MNEQIKKDRLLLEKWKEGVLENSVNTTFSLGDRHNTVLMLSEDKNIETRIGTIEDFIQNLLEAQKRVERVKTLTECKSLLMELSLKEKHLVIEALVEIENSLLLVREKLEENSEADIAIQIALFKIDQLIPKALQQ